MTDSLRRYLIKNYWMFILKGLLGVSFGLLSLYLLPIFTLNIFGTVFGPFIFCEGALSIIFFLKNRDDKPWLLLFDSLLCLSIGTLIILLWQSVTNTVIFILIAIWAVVTGLFRVIAAFNMYKIKLGAWLLGISALVSILFGLIIIIQPYKQNIFRVGMVGTFLIIFGTLMVIIGIYFSGINYTKKN